MRPKRAEQEPIAPTVDVVGSAQRKLLTGSKACRKVDLPGFRVDQLEITPAQAINFIRIHSNVSAGLVLPAVLYDQAQPKLFEEYKKLVGQLPVATLVMVGPRKQPYWAWMLTTATHIITFAPFARSHAQLARFGVFASHLGVEVSRPTHQYPATALTLKTDAVSLLASTLALWCYLAAVDPEWSLATEQEQNMMLLHFHTYLSTKPDLTGIIPRMITVVESPFATVAKRPAAVLPPSSMPPPKRAVPPSKPESPSVPAQVLPLPPGPRPLCAVNGVVL